MVYDQIVESARGGGLSCSIQDWMSERKGFIRCNYHNTTFRISERCPNRNDSHPFVADGNNNLDSGKVSKIDTLPVGSDRLGIGGVRGVASEIKKSIKERLHTHELSFSAYIDWDDVEGTLKYINKYSFYKLLDFDVAFVKAYKKGTVTITLRSTSEIYHRDVVRANQLSLEKFNSVIARLPSSIRLFDGWVTKLHNAFMNHPAAERNVKVFVDGKLRLDSDRSKGSPEFEAVDADHAISDSVLLEDDGLDKQMLETDYKELLETNLTRKAIAQSLNALILDRRYYAENLKSHVKSVRDLGLGVSELTNVIKELKNHSHSFSDRVSGDSTSQIRAAECRLNNVEVSVDGFSDSGSPCSSLPVSDSHTLFPSTGTLSFLDLRDKSRGYSSMRSKLLLDYNGWGVARW